MMIPEERRWLTTVPILVWMLADFLYRRAENNKKTKEEQPH